MESRDRQPTTSGTRETKVDTEEEGHTANEREAETKGGEEAVSWWLFGSVGVDLHVGDHYVIVGRIPVIVLVLLALSVIVGAMWLVVRIVRSLSAWRLAP